MKTLERTVGPVAVVAIAISAMLGSGIFVLPGLAAAITGPTVWLAYLVAGLCVLPAALSKSELATAIPAAGGTYVYIDRTLGPFAGTVAGLGVWLSLLLKSAFALVGFSAYMSALADLPIIAMALVLLVVVVALNIFGVRKVVKVQTAIVVLSLVGLATFAGAGAFHFNYANFENPFRRGGLGFIECVGFVIIAYNGVTKVASIAEEVENPGRNLPLGILASLIIVGSVYTSVTFILVANIPVEQLSADLRPIYTLAQGVGGPIAATVAAVLGVITMTSMANAGLLAASRYPFAMSRENLLPAWMGGISQRFKTPVSSIVVTGIVMAIAIVLLDVAALAKIASAIVMLLFTIVNVAVIVLREARVAWYRPVFSSPLYPWMQIFGIVAGLTVLVMLGPLVPLALVGTIIPGALIFFFYGRKNTSRRGVFGTLGKRKELSPRPKTEVEPKSVNFDTETAAVVVPLLGEERSPETLIEMGAALAGQRTIDVVHITDVPEQAPLDSMFADAALIASLRRRLNVMAEEENIKLRFENVVSHDVPDTVNNATIEQDCDWLVMEWFGKSDHGFGTLNPLGWFADNLSCNLALFKDAGVRRIREIVVMPDPGPNDALVASTADQLAQIHKASVTFVRFVPDDADDTVVKSQTDYLDQIRTLCRGETKVALIRGADQTKAIAAASASYDLLIFGGSTASGFFKTLFGTRRDKLTEQAACSVLLLKTSKAVIHPSVGTRPEKPAQQEGVLRYLSASCVRAKLDATKKEAVFAQASEAFADAFDEVTAASVREHLWEREKAQTTSIGHGIAIPHAIIPGLTQTAFGVFTTQTPLDVRAIDGEPVDLFFVTIGPPADRQVHLTILSELSRLIVEGRMPAELRAATDDRALLAALNRYLAETK